MRVAIAGHPGYYVDDQGVVWSDKPHNGKVGMRPLATRSGPNRYLSVTFWENRVPTGKAVHRLVLEAFIGPANGAVTRHLNGIKTDNRLVNLKYGTISENALDAVAHGVHPNARKTHCPKGHEYAARLTPKGHRRCNICANESNRASRL